jgi:hypothetical protein
MLWRCPVVYKSKITEHKQTSWIERSMLVETDWTAWALYCILTILDTVWVLSSILRIVLVLVFINFIILENLACAVSWSQNRSQIEIAE